MRGIQFFVVIALFTLVMQSCRKQDIPAVIQPAATTYSSTVATEWMHTIEKIVQSEGKNPPVASRIYAYMAIGLYESVLPGMPANQSLEGQIPGLYNLPDAATFLQLDYTTSANEAMYKIASSIFDVLAPANRKLIEDLHKKYQDQAYNRVMSEVVLNSVDFGKMVATAVLNRANNDNYATTRTLNYVVPSPLTDPAYWSATGPNTNPLEPFWGKIKCFAMAESGACTINSTIPFSQQVNSDFYKQAEEVRTTSIHLTEDQIAIAYWWSDGSSQTATPPGHWVAILDQLAANKQFDLGKTAELYAMMNITMADAFISCWDEKYKKNLLRPVTYINNYIQSGTGWKPLLSTPPFPEYPSGHSVASAAASDVLTRLLGNVAFTDSANVYLGYQPRSYNSFVQAADEAAISRLYGGIHFREAIDNGSKQGKEVSKVVFDKIKLRK